MHLSINFFKERVLFIITLVSLGLVFFTLALLYFSSDGLSSPLILRFDGLRGIDTLGTKADVWGVWLVGLFFSALNIFLGYVFFYRERALAYLFIGSSVLLSLLMLTVVGMVISIN